MLYKGKKVFVSGGAGVIGNELVKMLHEEGAQILVGDLKPRPRDWPKDIVYRQGDLNFITKEELDDFGPEIFFHLAATFERSTETYEFWEENYRHNVALSHHLMTVLKDSKTLKKVSFASSYLIYNKELYNFAKPAEKPYSLKETDPITPRNLTGSAKLNHEIELNFLQEFNKELKVQLVRIYRSYGKNSRDVISRWVRSLLKGEKLTVFNKENIFDYIYAGDVAEGLLRLAKTSATGIFNLGTGKSRRIEEVVAVLAKHFPKMSYQEVGQKILYEASQASVDKLERATGWTPKHRIEDAIPKIIKFEKEIGYSESKIQENVLITSISKKVGLIKRVREAMEKVGNAGLLFGGDMDRACVGSYFVDKFWKMPKTNDENFGAIMAFCQKNKIRYIIPSRDGELLFWAKHREELEKQKISVMISSVSAISDCVDKLAFFQKCKKLGLPAILTADNIDEIKSEKFVVKERYGAGSRSMALDVSKDEAVKHAEYLDLPIFQPFISGKEYSVDLYITKSGHVKGVVARERVLVVDGESQVTVTVNDKNIEKVAVQTGQKLGLFGHNILQVFVTKTGKCELIECNARFGGASSISIEAGLDSFYWFFLESSGEDITNYPFTYKGKMITQVKYLDNYISKE